ncbi:hypothetical protein BpHYR1_051908 [Brachionus plicatilis]|uniref:Uncharacterized protein n=1 Tax=Brachionus plicatilis TaxID=10195 RepID=A0A3M7RLN9_BRAPC|nr:hypothetical protein BpHYR1_051908 [Brachionus plicatilis]
MLDVFNFTYSTNLTSGFHSNFFYHNLQNSKNFNKLSFFLEFSFFTNPLVKSVLLMLDHPSDYQINNVLEIEKQVQIKG